MKIPVLSVWPGSDGADYHFQIDYKQSIEWFTEALIAVNKKCLEHGIKLGDRAEAVRAARALHDHPDRGVGDPRRAEGQPGVRRQQLRADDRLRPPEDGGDDRVDRRAISPSLPACRCTSSTSTTRGRDATIRT